jgi:PAS domain S-box-containing protein/putative nucleotidyltransferase with HDIG domain
MLYVNPAYEEVWGQTCQSLYDNPQSFFDSVFEADKPAVFSQVEKYLNTGKFDLEYRIVRGDGELRWVRAQNIPVLNDEGKVIRHTGIAVDITERRMLNEKVKQQRDNLAQRLLQSVNAISIIGELRDAYTAGHQRKVTQLACAIASEIGLSDESINNISLGALIHDIGKIYVAADILNKPGKLSDLEYQIIQTHAEYGFDIVKEIDFPDEIHTMIHQHHERLDGSGYPLGLSGEQIIIESRILAVADVVEAMTSHRPYRVALEMETALEELELYKGIKYDSDVVDICVKLFREKKFSFEEVT